jgi:cytochrome c oxidase subunit 2
VKTQSRLSLFMLLPALASCSRNPSVLLNTAGPGAEKIGNLFWYFLIVESVVGFLVLGILFTSLWRRREDASDIPLLPRPGSEGRVVLAVGGAVVVTTLILTSFVVASYSVDRKLIKMDRDPAVEIEVIAHQWWWELRYLNGDPSQVFTTANEIHVPLHKTIRLVLKSSDVIHSIWFPNITGKKDVIPGRNQDLFLQVDKAGEWEGRCAEFCGLEHAFMGIKLFAEPKEKFEAWKSAQLRPAAEPVSFEEKRGQQIFTTGACNICHAIRTVEVTSFSSNAPELTHLKSRTTIGAGAAPNSKGYLAGWIVDPHGIKPGVHMPTILQHPDDLQALLAYLEILK